MPKTKRLRSLLSRWAPPLAVFMAVSGLYAGGLLDFLEYRLLDAKFRILERAPSDTLVLVEIDPASLRELSAWPWPRSLHARLLGNLEAAGAGRIGLDIDFASRSAPDEDAALEAALAAADPPVVLPVFTQAAPSADESAEPARNAPLPALAEQAELASINVALASDGRARRLATTAAWGEIRLPTLFSRLARPAPDFAPTFYIDYGIAPAAIPRLSYADVLMNRFDPGLIEGKAVLVGASALELGDRLPAPLHGVLPGMTVQALGYESLVQGRALQRIAPEIILALVLATAILAMAWMKGRSWRGGLLTLAIGAAGTLWVSATLQAALPVILDTVPLLLALTLCFVLSQFRGLDRLTRRILAYRRALKHKAAFARGLTERALDGVLTLDRKGTIASVNPAAARMFGFGAEAAVGRPVSALLPEFEPEPREWRAKAAPGQWPEPLETVALRNGGERFPVRVAAGLGASPERAPSVILIHDLSAERAAEAEAEQARHRLRELAERLDEGMALYDRRDRLQHCNSRYRALVLGADAPDPTGLRFKEVLSAAAENGALRIPAEQRSEWLDDRLRRHRSANSLTEETLADGRVLQVCEYRTLEGGTVVLCSASSAARNHEAELERATRDADAARRSKTEFLANVSHELRTPLNAILGFSEIMIDEILGPLGNDNYKAYVRDIHGSGKHLLSIINDVLDASRLEQGSYILNEEYLDLRPLVDSSLRLAQERVRAGGHTVTVEIPDDLPALYADERAMKQVLHHILGNAIKFSPGGSTIGVRAELSDEDNLVLRIKDSGIGIDHTKMAEVISLFGQGETNLSRSYEGLGIGLPLAKSFMELHGGSIGLDSAPDQGTVVTLTFPASRLRRGREGAPNTE